MSQFVSRLSLLIGVATLVSTTLVSTLVSSRTYLAQAFNQAPQTSESLSQLAPEQTSHLASHLGAAASQTSLEQLPTGLYYYSQPDASPKRPDFVLFRKSGSAIIGWDHRSVTAPACFRGFLDGNQIVHATRVFAPYQPDSQLQQDETIDLTTYEASQPSLSDSTADTLQTCINFFWR